MNGSRLCLVIAAGAMIALAGRGASQPQPQPSPQPQRQMRPMAPVAVTGRRAEVATVAIADAAIPVVTVRVNGKGPFRFAVDTGAQGHARVSPKLAEALGLVAVGQAMAGDPSGRNARRVPIFRLDSIELGGLTFAGASASESLLPGPLAELDGVLGLHLFADLLLTFDYRAGRLIAERGALPAPDGRNVFGYPADPRGIMLPLKIGARSFDAVLDTGNSRQALFVPEALLAQLPTRGEKQARGIARTVSQEIAISAQRLAAPVTLGAVTLPVEEAAFPALGVANLGSRGLQGLEVTIDQKNRRVRVRAGPRSR